MSGAGAAKPAGSIRMLVVEDEPDVRALIARLLLALGEVREASDGAKALEMVTGGYLPDVIVSDVMMPNMDGLTLAKELRKDPRTARVPLVFLTAKTGPKDVIAGINAGARHYVTKPFKAEELLGKVRKALGR